MIEIKHFLKAHQLQQIFSGEINIKQHIPEAICAKKESKTQRKNPSLNYVVLKKVGEFLIGYFKGKLEV